MVTHAEIAAELGRVEPVAGDPVHVQWSVWIDRAYRVIRARATRLGVPYASLDEDAVDDVVVYAVVRRATRALDGAESTTDLVSVDDASWNRTRRYQTGMGDMHFLDEWWGYLGLGEPVSGEWSGSIAYSGRR